MYNRNLKAYKTTSLDAEMAVADPHRVIQMLMQGLLERLAQAMGNQFDTLESQSVRTTPAFTRQLAALKGKATTGRGGNRRR